MSEQIIIAIIGATGGIIAALVPQISDWIEAARSSFPTNTQTPSGNWAGGEPLDIRELRLLRSLVGEDAGRSLHIYRNSDYYRPALDSLSQKGLVKLVDKNYHLTAKGNRYTRSYLRWLSRSWKPN